jgi:uncharacterized membrane protein YeaQ/YmgE (transglycosylase-associated protein family)
MRYGRLPAPRGFWRRIVVGLLVLVFGPAIFAVLVSTATTLLNPVIPWIIGSVVIVILYRLVFRLLRR